MEHVEPLPLLPEDDDLECVAAPAFEASDEQENEFVELKRKQRAAKVSQRDDQKKASTELGQRLAHRVLRDALSLQLARRGFDGLRSSSMNLLTELTSNFIVALGTELKHYLPAEAGATSMVPLVIRAQQLVNMRSAAEWRQAQELYSQKVSQLPVLLASVREHCIYQPSSLIGAVRAISWFVSATADAPAAAQSRGPASASWRRRALFSCAWRLALQADERWQSRARSS